MCFNCIIISFKRLIPDDQLLEKLITKMLDNPHGYAIYSYPYSITRTLSFKKALKAIVKTLETKKAMHTHFRRATSGAIDISNIHLWYRSGLLISHNGIVFSFASYKERKSDTKKLIEDARFEKAIKERDFNDLWQILRAVQFWGVMLMSSIDFKEIYIIAKGKNAYKTIYKNMYIISNEPLISFKSEPIDEGIYRFRNGNIEEIVKAEKEHYEYLYPYVNVSKSYTSYVYDIHDIYDYDEDSCVKCKIKSKIEIKKSKKNKKNNNYNIYDDYAFF